MRSNKYIVVYDSLSGFTRQYAQWIAQDLDSECVSIDDINRQLLKEYQCVIIGGHVRYENLSHRRHIARLIEGHDNVVLFVVGASPTTDRIAVGFLMRRIYKSMPQFRFVPHFYFQGGLNYDLILKSERYILRFFTGYLRLLVKMNILKAPKVKEALERMSGNFDLTNRARIEVLIEYVSQQ